MASKRRGHGEGAIYRRHTTDCPPSIDGERPEHACRGGWVAQVDLGMVDGKRKRKTIYGSTRKETAIKLQEALAARKGGTLVVGRVTVETWMRYWLDVVCPERGLKPNSLRAHRSKVETWIIPHLGHHQLERLEAHHIRALYAEMRKAGRAEGTIGQVHAVMHRALKVAKRERKVSRNVADDFDAPTVAKQPRKGLELADAKKVLKAAGDDPRFYLALLLGIRQGEALALRWSHVNLEQGWIFIEQSLSRVSGEFLFVTPKNRTSIRYLPLLPAVRSRLAVKWAHHLAAGGTVDDLVFTTLDGNPVHPRVDYRAWTRLLDEAGVSHVPLHAARNTTSTLLRAFGATDREVADILGHANVAMTRHYQADDLEIKRRAVAALEAALSDHGGGEPEHP